MNNIAESRSQMRRKVIQLIREYRDEILHMSNEDLLEEYKRLLFSYYPLINAEDGKKIGWVKDLILYRMWVFDNQISVEVSKYPPDWYNDKE